MNTRRSLAICAALLLASAGTSSAQTVKLEFLNGRVNLITQNAPMRLVLAEWARLGGTRIVGGDAVTGPPVTLEITGYPERQALDVLLRGVPGYMLTAREVAGTGASTFDRIMILPTTSTPRPSAAVATFGPPPPVFQDGADDIDDDRDDRAIRAEEQAARARAELDARLRAAEQALRAAEQAQRGGANQPGVTTGTTNGFVTIRPGAPQPFVTGPEVEPAAPARPGAAQPPTPSNPFTSLPGSSRPGEITPVPQQPNGRQPPTGTER